MGHRRRSRDGGQHGPFRAPVAVTMAAVFATSVLSGCAQDDPGVNSPGTNLRVNDVAIRYAHLENTEDEDGWVEGDDVPLYLWFQNEADESALVTSVESPLATSVALTDGALPLSLPPGRLVQMGPREDHFVLEDIRTQIRGQEFVPVVLTFADGTSVEFEVEAIDVNPEPPDVTPQTSG